MISAIATVDVERMKAATAFTLTRAKRTEKLRVAKSNMRLIHTKEVAKS